MIRSRSDFSQNIQDWSAAYRGTDVVIVIMELAERIVDLEKRVSLLQPNLERIEKYPALKESYEAYKILDNLIGKDE